MHSLCAAAICFWCFKQDNFCPLYEKSKGGGLSPSGKFQNVNHFRILSFKMETSNRPSFNEIGEMTCITHAWLSPGETLKQTESTVIFVVHEVIFQKRVRGSYQGFQTRDN